MGKLESRRAKVLRACCQLRLINDSQALDITLGMCLLFQTTEALRYRKYSRYPIETTA